MESITMTVKRYVKEDFKYILSKQHTEQIANSWYNLFINTLTDMFIKGYKVTIVKDGSKVIKAVLISKDGLFKTERTFDFN